MAAVFVSFFNFLAGGASTCSRSFLLTGSELRFLFVDFCATVASSTTDDTGIIDFRLGRVSRVIASSFDSCVVVVFDLVLLRGALFFDDCGAVASLCTCVSSLNASLCASSFSKALSVKTSFSLASFFFLLFKKYF